MKFFEKFFKDVDFDNVNSSNEVQMLCPFPHSLDANGNPIFETRPSASINVDTSLFYCQSCNRGYNEEQFICEVENISKKDARKLLNTFENEQDINWEENVEKLYNPVDNKRLYQDLGISDEVAKSLKLGYSDGGLGFPVFIYDTLLDVRTYKKNGKPKCKSCAGAKEGLIIPYDLWKKSKKVTLLCAGEKDMAIARTKGFNAITLTGGELKLPDMFKKSFENKKVYICYDNDEAGKKGALKMAKYLFQCGAKPFIVTGHHDVCVEKGGDIWDFFQKYEKTREDLINILKQTKEFTEKDYEEAEKKEYPLCTLLEASLNGKNRNKILTSTIQVSSTFDTSYSIADLVEFKKVIEPDDKSVFTQINDTKTFSIDETNIEKILYLMQNELEINNFYRNCCGIPKNEKGILFRKVSNQTVFKYVVTDYRESEVIDENSTQIEFTCYTIDKPLLNGGKYKVKYKLIPHPLQNQKLVMIVLDVKEANDSVSKFKVTPEVVNLLRPFMTDLTTNVKDKMNELYLRAKDIVGKFLNDKIYYTTDLFYHTPLNFYYGGKLIRGHLDNMIIGETRTGKSKTADSLLKVYELGTFLTLKTSTTVGLIGGSKGVNGSWKITIGAIPRNNGGAVIMEEFQGSPPDFIRNITDIRSSNKVRITRADGELIVDCKVRMLTLSNQKSDNNGTKSLKSYPNGIEVIKELIEANEDIARYDMFTLVGEPENYISPFERVEMLPMFDKKNYMARVRWAWSRKPENIIFSENSDQYIWDKSEELNNDFNCHIKLFGSEASQKLARVSVAVACMVVSTDDTFENVIVKKEHVDWAVNFYRQLYDNDLFRLKEYVDEERKYSAITDEDISYLQDLYTAHTTLLSQLEHCSVATRTQLMTISGEEKEDFKSIMNALTRKNFIRWRFDNILPSEKLRIGLKKINKNSRLERVDIL